MTQQSFNLLISGVLGACWGSFLNAAYYRIANNISLSSPPSHCPNCKKNIPPYLNVPVVGWAFTGGKCFNCRKPISIHYPAFEALVGLFFILCALWVGNAWAACLLGALFSVYALGAVYDHKYMILPDLTLYGGLIFAGATAIAFPQVVNPQATHDAPGIIRQLAGGLALTIILLAIKYGAAPFYKFTMELKGRGVIDEKGVTLYYGGKEEVTTWQEFAFSKVIPMGSVRITKGLIAPEEGATLVGAPETATDGEMVIYDGSVKIQGREAALRHTIEFSADRLQIWRNTMGMGDIRLVGSLGILVGLYTSAIFDMFMVSAVSYVLVGGYNKYFKGGGSRFAFGPFLILGTIYVLLSRYGYLPAILPLLQHK